MLETAPITNAATVVVLNAFVLASNASPTEGSDVKLPDVGVDCLMTAEVKAPRTSDVQVSSSSATVLHHTEKEIFGIN